MTTGVNQSWPKVVAEDKVEDMGGGGMGGGNWGGFTQTTAQGYNYANYGVDIAIRKDFMKEKRASLTLSVNDIFKTRVSGQFSESEFFTQTCNQEKGLAGIPLEFQLEIWQV